MNKKYIKPEIEVINFQSEDVIMASVVMVQGTVHGSTGYMPEQNLLVGGTVGGAVQY